MELGADTEQLRAFAVRLRSTGADLRRSRRDIERAVQSAVWEGPDATAFRGDWRARARAMSDGADVLVRLADRLDAQAGEQEHASETSGATRAPEQLHSGRAPSAGPRLERTEQWELSALGGTGVVAGASATGTVEDLEGPNSRVSVSTRASVGGQLSAGDGAQIRVGHAAVGEIASADATAAVTATHTDTWVVPDDDAEPTLRLAAADAGFETAARGGGVARVVDWGVDRLQDLGVVPHPGPPDTTTELLGVTLAGTAVGTAVVGPTGLSGTGRVAGEETVQVGRRQRDGGSSFVLTGSGTIAGGLTVAMLGQDVRGPAGSANGVVDLEVFPAEHGTRRVELTLDQVIGDEADRIQIVALLDDATAGSAWDDAWDALGRGDLDGATEALSGLPAAVLGTSVVASTGTVSGRSYGVDLTSSMGVGGSATATAGHTETDWE